MSTSHHHKRRHVRHAFKYILVACIVLVIFAIAAWSIGMFEARSLFSFFSSESPRDMIVQTPNTPSSPSGRTETESVSPTESDEAPVEVVPTEPELISDSSDTTITATTSEVATDDRPIDYIEVVESCGPHFEGECVNVRGGTSTSSPIVAKLRTGQVLKAGGTITVNGRTWVNIMFNEKLSYPERITSDWFVAADLVKIVYDEGERSIWSHEVAPTDKRIVVDRSEQKLYAYEGNTLFLETPISTGLELTPTPHGEFKIFYKTPSRYMQGPTPGSDQVYDLPGVPWNMYFTEDGSVIHGAYWHNNFGRPWSHGCVNLPLNVARKLYNWAPLGTKVVVQE